MKGRIFSLSQAVKTPASKHSLADALAPSTYPIVLFETIWKQPADGWAVASRAYARAMGMAGVDVRLSDWLKTGPISEEVLAELPGLNFRPPAFPALSIWSSPLRCYDQMQMRLDELARQRAAYYCVFERLRIEDKLAQAFNKINGIWVQCEINRDVLVRHGVRNVTLIRYPLFDDDPMRALPSPRPVTNDEPMRFLYVGRFEPRKSPGNIIRAFLRAFRPGETARLTMKLSPFAFPLEQGTETSPESTLLYELDEPDVARNGWTARNWRRSICIVRDRLSRSEMVRLYAAHDAYVSASRGEGLDLPCWDAKVSGMRVVTAPSGGPEDFMGERDIVLPRTGEVSADPRYEWGEGATYANYSLDALTEALRRVAGESRQDGRNWDASRHRAPVIGKQLRDWIEERRIR